MPIRYKIDVLKELKEKGYSSYSLRVNKTLSESTLQKLRTGDTKITLENVETLCRLLQCDVGDILEYKETNI